MVSILSLSLILLCASLVLCSVQFPEVLFKYTKKTQNPLVLSDPLVDEKWLPLVCFFSEVSLCF
jgi:hypothetical protein